MKLVCEECGGSNIQVKAWVDANSNRFIEEAVFDSNDCWCDDCEENVYFISEKEFKDEQEDL